MIITLDLISLLVGFGLGVCAVFLVVGIYALVTTDPPEKEAK